MCPFRTIVRTCRRPSLIGDGPSGSVARDWLAAQVRLAVRCRGGACVPQQHSIVGRVKHGPPVRFFGCRNTHRTPPVERCAHRGLVGEQYLTAQQTCGACRRRAAGDTLREIAAYLNTKRQ